MASSTELPEVCLGCLCSAHECNILEYSMRYDHFKVIFKVGSIKLCYLCRRIAQHAELFIENVQKNQIILKNYIGDISTTIQEIHSHLQLPITLVHTPVETNQLSGQCSNSSLAGVFLLTNNINTSSKMEIDESTVFSTNEKELKNNSKILEISISDDLTNDSVNDIIYNQKIIKVELKEEDVLSDLEGGLADEFQGPCIKEEDDLPLKQLVKQEQIQGVDVMSLPTLRKTNVKKSKQSKEKETKTPPKSTKNQLNRLEYNKSKGIEAVYLTDEQFMEERKQMALEERYLSLPYKCEDCVVAFRFKASHELHRARHAEARGPFQCELCKLRMASAAKLNNHRRYHFIRFKCVQCGLLRLSRQTIKEHQSALHGSPEDLYCCPHCKKTFKRRVSFRKHVQYSHERRARAPCPHCAKMYAENALKPHIVKHHPNEVGVTTPAQRHACSECAATFAFPSELRTHSVTHSHARPAYCVECDKSFKNEFALKNHLRIAKRHVNYLDLPLSCEDCGKRFGLTRELERHRNHVHLQARPYSCETCDKTYMTKWAAQDHARRAHGGYRDPRRFACQLCHKAFSASEILKAHIRTHTGERPYACGECGAAFSQSGALHTHARLVHRQLARAGLPRASTRDA